MRYIKFEIENFKGIKKLTIDLLINPAFRATTLVGLNESGKTTILEAIDLLQRDLDEEQCFLLIPRSNQFKFTGAISITATLELDEEDNEYLAKEGVKNRFILTKPVKQLVIKKTFNFTKGKFVGPVSFEHEALFIGTAKGSKAGSPDKKLSNTDPKYTAFIDIIESQLRPPIIYYPNFLADFPTKIYLKARRNEGSRQREYRRVMQDILDSLDDDEQDFTLEEDILERIENNTEEDDAALKSLLLTMSARITADVFGAWRKILRPEDSEALSDKQIVVAYGIEEVTPASEGVEAVFIPFLTIKVQEGSESYAISERSLGFRWFFSYFLFTEFRKHRAIDKGEILFLIDEPASNLHSTAQLKLVETFQELVKKSRLIYTTHSHHLINPDWLEGAYIVQNKALDYEKELTYNSSRTDVDALPYRQFVANHPNQQTYFQPILDKLEYRPSLLESVPDIVIVEGKNDFYTLHYVNEVFLAGRYNNLNLCPGNGAGNNVSVIQLYIAWGRNFVVICDGDTAGIEAKDKYLKLFGKIMEGRIFTLGDVQSSFVGKSMEGLFSSDAEKIRITQEIFPKQISFSKEKFNQAIQNLLFLKQAAKFNKPSVENIEKVLGFLDSKMFPPVQK